MQKERNKSIKIMHIKFPISAHNSEKSKSHNSFGVSKALKREIISVFLKILFCRISSRIF